MKKENVELINFRIKEKTKEKLTQSPLHKTPLYFDEYQIYLEKKKQEIQNEINFKVTSEKLKEDKFKPKSRDLISKFKNNNKTLL